MALERQLIAYLLRDIDPDLWRQVKAKAALKDLTIKALIEQLLRKWVTSQR